MGRHMIWITIVVTLHFSAVLCSNPFHEYFYNKYHHKGHSSTASVSSSTSDVSSEEITASSVSDYASLQDILHSSPDLTSLKNLLQASTVNHEATAEGNMTILQYGDIYSAKGGAGIDGGLLAGIIIMVLFAVGLFFCCCLNTCSRKRKEGMVLSTNETTSVLPRQNIFNHTQIPNYTEEPVQQHPTHYQSQPVQQHPTHYQSQPVQQHPAHYQSHPVQQYPTHYESQTVQQYPTHYQSQPVPQPPYYSAVPSLYQHNGPSLMQSHEIPESPPPEYEAPFEFPSQEAPPYEKTSGKE